MDNAALIDMMVKAGFRCTIITLHTELTAKQVTSARKRLNVVSRGGSGPLPLGSRILASKARVIEAALFMGAYLRGARKPLLGVDVEAVIAAHQSYLGYREALNFTPTECLSIDEAWVVAREYRSKDLVMRACRCCQLSYVALTSTNKSTCPYCSQSVVKDRFHCDVNDAAMSDRPAEELLALALNIQQLTNWGYSSHEIMKQLGLNQPEYLTALELLDYKDVERREIVALYPAGDQLVRALVSQESMPLLRSA